MVHHQRDRVVAWRPEDGASLEVVMADRDSAIGFPGILRESGIAIRAQEPIAGAALRVSASVLQAAIKQESEIYVPLPDHTHTLSKQIAQATVCSQFHTTDQRFARWLLLVRDRTRNGAFNITHEATAQILDVSRRGVSLAAGALRIDGLIRYTRGGSPFSILRGSKYFPANATEFLVER